MKSWLLSLSSIALGGALLVATGCSKDPEQYTVVFRQDGQADITYTVDEGSDITDLPTPKAVTGYTVVWDRTTLQNITENIIVTAVATANEYTITYAQEDGVTLDEYTQTVVYDGNYQLKTPDKDLYTFDGWYNDTTLVEQSGVWKIASDVTLTAHWADNSYTVTFVNLDGTTVAHTLEKGEVLDASKIPAVQTKEGYDTKWSVEDFSNISEDTTVETVATAKTYTITYALATGETIVGATTQTVVYDASYQLATPDKYLYSFGGWKTADGTPVDQNGVWNIASDVTLTAQWSDNSYTVTFVNLDSTTVAHTLEKGEVLATSKIPAVQTKEGYDTKWSVEDFSNISVDTTVTTVATAKTYTITYALATGETIVGATTQTVVYDANYELQTGDKRLYKFEGWKTADGTPVNQSGVWKIASDVTLTAQWSDNSYTVTFTNLAGETVATYTLDKRETLAANQIPAVETKVGYGTKWSVEDFSNISVDTTVTTVETAKTYTITYALATGETIEGGATTQTVVYDASYELKTPAKYLYKFDGWYNGTAPVDQNGVWNIASDVTLTAQWSDNSYTVTFTHLDGTTVAHTLEKGEVLDASKIPTVQTKVGYDTKWSVEDFSNISVDTTVTTVETAKTYTITYVLKEGETIDGETGSFTQTVTYDSGYTLATPKNDVDAEFAYWAEADGTYRDQTGKWTIANNVELHANWRGAIKITFKYLDGTEVVVDAITGTALDPEKIPELPSVTGYNVSWSVTDFSTVMDTMTEITEVRTPKTYTITYSVPADATLAETSATVKYDSEYTLATPVRYGYNFAGWKMADGTILKSGDQWKIDGDVTLTAVWEDNFFVVTFVNTDDSRETVMVQNGDDLSKVTTPELKQVTGYTVAWNVEDFSTVKSEATITAVKTAKTYTITYELKDSENIIIGETTQTVVYGAEYKLNVPGHSDVNMYFTGWVNAAGEKVASSGVWQIASDVTLTATWYEFVPDNWTGNH